ncbi:LysM-like peptidoglycan-binding domain-containing protein [Photobacterium satsumensis]|uniref:LysM-like peptidoglycan-binding domain-containing protein n=1 Tax=Photobacterium satsumensis TaxID=2910239 RepID=UPI003D147403
MGQAKRRSNKKSEFTWPRITFDKEAFKQGGAAIRAKFAPLENKWQQLPKLHRRALAVLVPVTAVLLIMPVGKQTVQVEPSEPVRRELSLNLESQPPQSVVTGEREEPVSPPRPSNIRPLEPVKSKPVASKPVAKQPEKTVASSSSQSANADWQRYQVKSGETLANIFRQHNLPLTDLYAVAAIEGDDKPLSRIKAGQWLRYRQTAQGGLDALQIERRNSEPVLFFRRSDGSFVRRTQ